MSSLGKQAGEHVFYRLMDPHACVLIGVTERARGGPDELRAYETGMLGRVT